MKALSLKTKLLIAVLSMMAILVVVLTWRSYAGITKLSDKLTAMTSKWRNWRVPRAIYLIS